MEVEGEREPATYVTAQPAVKVSSAALLQLLVDNTPETEHVKRAKIALNLRVIPDDSAGQKLLWEQLWERGCVPGAPKGIPTEYLNYIPGTSAPYSRVYPPCLPGEAKVLALTMEKGRVKYARHGPTGGQARQF